MSRLFGAALLAFLFHPVSASAAELILDQADSFIIAAEVNGRPLRLRVDPAAPGTIVLNPGAAAAAGLKKSMVGAVAAIGPVRVKGHSSSAPVVIAGTRARRRLAWFERDMVDGADGLISPADLPFDGVTFRLRPQRPGERSSTLLLHPSQERSLGHPMTIGGVPMLVSLTLRDEGSRATASAAALIAEHQGGRWTGEPSRRPVFLGVLRPVRPMALERPLPVGALMVDDLLVRTTDHRGDYELPPDAAGDPDEILVVGQGKKQRARLRLEIGRRDLSGCSSVRYVRVPQRLELSCLPPAP